MGIHGAIEWGNRLFSVVVGIVAVATLAAAWWRRPRRTPIVWCSLLVAVGVPAQALIGFATVESGLNPWVVSCHFLVTIGMLAAAFTGWKISREPDGEPQLVVPKAIRTLTLTTVAAALATIVIGVLVTGAGPHAGDPDSPRIPIDPGLLSQLHADSVFLLLGLSVALVFVARAIDAPRPFRRAVMILLIVELAQGAIGFIQLFTGLPIILVGAHMLGAALLWLAVLHLTFSTKTLRLESELSQRTEPPVVVEQRQAAATP